MNTLTPTQQEIALRAYHIYLNGGCPHGRDWEHWFQAEKELGSKFFTPPASSTPAPKKAVTKAAPEKPAAKKSGTEKAAEKPAPKKAGTEKAPAGKTSTKKAAAKK